MKTRIGICWYEHSTTLFPAFLWRDRDSDHPAHLYGAEVSLAGDGVGYVRWRRFDLKALRAFRRRDSLYMDAMLAKQFARDPNLRPAQRRVFLLVRQLWQRANWLTREVRAKGPAITLPEIEGSISRVA